MFKHTLTYLWARIKFWFEYKPKIYWLMLKIKYLYLMGKYHHFRTIYWMCVLLIKELIHQRRSIAYKYGEVEINWVYLNGQLDIWIQHIAAGTITYLISKAGIRRYSDIPDDVVFMSSNIDLDKDLNIGLELWDENET